MITTCTSCSTNYRLDAAKVPQRLIRVRCPKCESVFKLDGVQTSEDNTQTNEDFVIERSGDAAQDLSVQPEIPTAVAEKKSEPPAAAIAEPVSTPESDFSSETTSEVDSTPPISVAEVPAKSQSNIVSESAPAAVADKPKRSRRHCDKSEMLARALVSDILVYNQDIRDKALADGTLLEALGGEIKKSWELYKEKVTPEVANSTTHFRDALNEILAEGKKVF